METDKRKIRIIGNVMQNIEIRSVSESGEVQDFCMYLMFNLKCFRGNNKPQCKIPAVYFPCIVATDPSNRLSFERCRSCIANSNRKKLSLS